MGAIAVADGDVAGLVLALAQAAEQAEHVDIELAAGGCYTMVDASGGAGTDCACFPCVRRGASVRVLGRGARIVRGSANLKATTSTPCFRFWEVLGGGTLALEEVVLERGRVKGGFGGAVSVCPGGALTLTRCRLAHCESVGLHGETGGSSGGGGGGGGQGACGGAVFSRGGSVCAQSCDFSENRASGGLGGDAWTHRGRYMGCGGKGGGDGGGQGGPGGEPGKPAGAPRAPSPSSSSSAMSPAMSSVMASSMSPPSPIMSPIMSLSPHQRPGPQTPAGAEPGGADRDAGGGRALAGTFRGCNGGGGGGSAGSSGFDGGAGEWGGGGGGAGAKTLGGFEGTGVGGSAGFGGGDGGTPGASSGSAGGGGGAFGGAVCCMDGGSLQLRDCTLKHNACAGGKGGRHPWGWPVGHLGQSFGGAVFAWNVPQVTVEGVDTPRVAFNVAQQGNNVWDSARVKEVHLARFLVSKHTPLVELFSTLRIPPPSPSQPPSQSQSPLPSPDSPTRSPPEGQAADLTPPPVRHVRERAREDPDAPEGDDDPGHDRDNDKGKDKDMAGAVRLPARLVESILEQYVGWEL